MSLSIVNGSASSSCSPMEVDNSSTGLKRVFSTALGGALNPQNNLGSLGAFSASTDLVANGSPQKRAKLTSDQTIADYAQILLSLSNSKAEKPVEDNSTSVNDPNSIHLPTPLKKRGRKQAGLREALGPSGDDYGLKTVNPSRKRYRVNQKKNTEEILQQIFCKRKITLDSKEFIIESIDLKNRGKEVGLININGGDKETRGVQEYAYAPKVGELVLARIRDKNSSGTYGDEKYYKAKVIGDSSSYAGFQRVRIQLERGSIETIRYRTLKGMLPLLNDNDPILQKFKKKDKNFPEGTQTAYYL